MVLFSGFRISTVAAALVIFTALAAQRTPAANLEVLQLRPNFYMIAGAGGNVGFQVGVDGVVVVDSGSAASADAVVAAIKKVTTQPIRYIINTSADADHVGGNAIVAKAGQTIFTGNGGAGLATNFLGGGASILSAEQVLTRMSGPSGKPSPYPIEAWPTETFNQPRKYMYLNGEGIEVFRRAGRAHRWRCDCVLSPLRCGGGGRCVLIPRRFPVIDVAKGGSIQLAKSQPCRSWWIRPFRRCRSCRARRARWSFPGHGRLCDQLDVVDYRDMVTIIRDRVRDL